MKMPTNLALNYEMPDVSETGEAAIKCLLLEDDRFDRITFKRLNSRSNLNMQVLEATSVSQAREYLSSEKIDVLVLDNDLPDGLGMVLSRELRNVKKFADLPMIMISGTKDEQFIAASLEAGCTAVLDKTDMTSERLEAVITSAIRDCKPNSTGTALSAKEMDAAMRKFTSDKVMNLNAPVLRLIRLSRKLQTNSNDGQINDHSSTAAEIEALSYALQRQLNDLIIYDQPGASKK